MIALLLIAVDLIGIAPITKPIPALKAVPDCDPAAGAVGFDVITFDSRTPDSNRQHVGHLNSPLAALYCTHPQPGILREHCDLIEVNSMYDDQSRLVFTQLLFYDWHSDAARFNLVAWRMVKPAHSDKQSVSQPLMLPRYSHAHGEWICEWLDGDVWRRVSATNARETWTQFDPELEDREWLPKEKRKELRKAATK